MLTSLSERLWGTYFFRDDDVKGEEDDVESPGKSTSASDDEVEAVGSPCVASLDLSSVRCAVWEMDGEDAQEVMQSACLSLCDDRLVVAEGSTTREFRFAEMRHFHQQQEEIFQWVVKKGAEEVAEFGLLFPSATEGRLFSREVRPRLRQLADLLCRRAVIFREYNGETKEWRDTECSAVLSILQRPGDLEGYLVVTDSEETVLTEIGISHDEYIFPQPSESQLSWWGPAEGTGDRRMYGAKFPEETEEEGQVFDCLQRVLREHALERKIEGPIGQSAEYDDDAFDVNAADREDIVWMDVEEGPEADSPPVVTRDTSRAVAAKNPCSKYHKMMYVGSDRTFIVRGAVRGEAEMQIHKWDGGSDAVVATLEADKLAYEGRNLCPNKALLRDGESKLLMLNEGDANRVYMMDVEREQVVQAWTAGDDTAIHNLIPKSKDAAMTSEPTFLASNPKAVFAMDTRVGEKKGKSDATGARTTTLSYATNVQFTCGTTDEKGHILMGSKTGDMRLYDGEANKDGKFKRAKTHLQGLGDPLLHVSVTRDGSWILGTCAKYLVLFPVKLAGNGKTGFLTSLGKSKPPPIVLKLSMDDVLKWGLQDVNFVKAEFNADETAIVTSTGNLAIVWDFWRVVDGKCHGEGAYTIRAADDYIKDVDFMKTGRQENIVMATPCGVSTKPILTRAI